MAVVDLKLPHHQYQIHIQPGLLVQLGALTMAVAKHERGTIIADESVQSLHLPTAMKSMEP